MRGYTSHSHAQYMFFILVSDSAVMREGDNVVCWSKYHNLSSP